MAALAPATANIKSQDPVALERRLKRLRSNPDHQLLCRAKDTKIAELEKYLEELAAAKESENKAWTEVAQAYRECTRAHQHSTRNAEVTLMKCEEANTYRIMAKAAENVMLEEAQKRFLLEIQVENLKRKRNPGRTGGGKRGRPKKIAAKSVFVDDELAQLGPPGDSLMEAG